LSRGVLDLIFGEKVEAERKNIGSLKGEIKLEQDLSGCLISSPRGAEKQEPVTGWLFKGKRIVRLRRCG